MHAARKSRARAPTHLEFRKSSAPSGTCENFLIVRTGARSERGGTIAWTPLLGALFCRYYLQQRRQGAEEVTMRAGIYVRISDDREGRAVGVARQEEDCRALAAARGWQVVEVYSDNDTSATSGKVRRAYRQMLTDLENGRLDAIVAYSSSRFYRRVRDLDELATLLEARHVEVATCTSGRIDLSTADGRMTARLLAVIDQGEAERIGERSRRAKADIKASGGWLGGGATAYGYERVMDERGKVVEHRIVAAEAAVLREIAQRALGGESLSKLAAELNRRGIKPRRGDRWQPSRLRAMLTSPFHAGRHADGTVGTWPAIFNEDEATLLRARFPNNGQGAGRGKGPRTTVRYPLSGLVVCSACGRKLLGAGGAYKCQVRNGGCGSVGIRTWLLDRYVDERLWARNETWEGEMRRNVQPAADTEALVTAIQAAEQRTAELHEAYAAGELTLEDFKAMREAVARRQDEAEARLRELAPVAPVALWPDLEDKSDLEFYRRWQARELTDEEIADVNALFRRWIEKVVVTPALRRGRLPAGEDDTPRRVTIQWK
jgi:DNA invertase Pin-like site-specific DNA recombinase